MSGFYFNNDSLVESLRAQVREATELRDYHAKRADDALDLLRDERDARRAERAELVRQRERLETERDLAMACARESQARFDVAREEIAHLRQGIAAYSALLPASLEGHTYEGKCPDENQPDARDTSCSACGVLLSADAWRERDRNRAEGRQEIKTEVGK